MKETLLVDTHCHLDFPEFNDDRENIMTHCIEHGSISAIIVPGVCRKDWHRVLTLCEQYDCLHPALGLHPCFIQAHRPDDLTQLEQYCQQFLPVAIGEIGLDYFILKGSDNAPEQREQQIHYFHQQLQIASQFQLPVLIHARKSHDEIIRQLKTIQPLNGIIHAFSGSYEQAKEYLKLGFKLGFGGAFTYPKAHRLRALVTKLPIDAWVLETDAPDMAPVNHQGQHNSPLFLSEIAEVFTFLYEQGKDTNVILAQLYQNTRSVFPFLPETNGNTDATLS